MNILLEQRRRSLDCYIQQLTPDELDVPFAITRMTCDAIMHGDHNLMVKLRIIGADGTFLFRCLRIDASDTTHYKQKEYEGLKLIEGRSLGPQVFSWKAVPPLLIREWIEPISPVAGIFENQREFFLRECAGLYHRLHTIDISLHLNNRENTQNPRSRYIDFINALTMAAQKSPGGLEKWKEAFLQTLTSQETQDFPMQGKLSITQLSPKDGNLVFYNGSPFFLDWDTVRFTDKERDIAVFIGTYAETIEDARYFLNSLPHYNSRLIACYLRPVMLWRELRGGDKLDRRRFHDLKEIERGIKIL